MLASIKPYFKQFIINAEELELVKTFHAYIFEDILGMKNEMFFNPEIASFQTLLIPLKRNEAENCYEIDYHVLQETVQGFPPQLTEEQRQTFEYNPSQYEDAVVKPWYRPNEREACYVGEISTGVYPTSQFPDPKYEVIFVNYHF